MARECSGGHPGALVARGVRSRRDGRNGALAEGTANDRRSGGGTERAPDGSGRSDATCTRRLLVGRRRCRHTARNYPDGIAAPRAPRRARAESASDRRRSSGRRLGPPDQCRARRLLPRSARWRAPHARSVMCWSRSSRTPGRATRRINGSGSEALCRTRTDDPLLTREVPQISLSAGVVSVENWPQSVGEDVGASGDVGRKPPNRAA